MREVLEYLAGLCRDLFGNAVIKAVAALSGGAFLGHFDWLWVATKALFLLMCLDFGMGLWLAWKANKVSLSKVKRGVGKYVLYLVAILVAHYVDQSAQPLVHVNFRALLILYLSVCEALSIFRHLCSLGVPIPKHLVKRLETLRDCELPQQAPKEQK